MDIEYSGVAITDADGNYEIVGLLPGDYRVDARVKTFPIPGEIELDRRAGKFPERQKPRRTTSAFTIEKGDKRLDSMLRSRIRSFSSNNHIVARSVVPLWQQ